MFTLGTRLCSRVNILPGSCSTKHIIHFFQLWILPICYLARDVVHVGAGVAREAVAARALLDDQPVPAARAEEQHGRHRLGAPGSARGSTAQGYSASCPLLLLEMGMKLSGLKNLS